MSRNMLSLKTLALVGAILAYAGAVIYGDIMFLGVVQVAFPGSGIFQSLAIAGALVTALSALVLPIALHWWFAPGLQFVAGVIFWVVDIAALAMNSILAFQVASGGVIDPWIETWRAWSPATPMLAVLGWGLMFMLDESHKMRHAMAELEADQIDIYATRLRAAAKSQDVSDEITEAAKQAAWDFSQRLNSAHLPSKSRLDELIEAFKARASETPSANGKKDMTEKRAEGSEPPSPTQPPSRPRK